MESTKKTALAALRLIFRPIARILLKSGVNWKELVEVCKATYVEVATEDFGIRGRPTNVSRVAILTGFSRREVGRLRNLLNEDQSESVGRMNQAGRVLTGWFTDEAYIDSSGQPIPLPVNGNDPSFESLCDRYSGDVPATTMLKELKHVGAVAEQDDGRVIAKLRYYMPVHTDPEQMLRTGAVLEDIGETVAWNLHRSEDDPSRFEGRAVSTQVPAKVIPEFREFIEQEGQAFFERVDAWLTDHEDENASNPVRLGLGSYWIEERTNERKKP